jgi:uncharacterized oxidoreductase
MQSTNNTILITGGTSGIGLELVKRFYELNNNVIVTSSNSSNLDNLKNQFPNIKTIVCDLGDTNSVKQLINNCLANYPEINVLINNAGVQYNYDWLEDKDAFQKIENEITINFTSPMQLAYGLLPILKNKNEAAIINVSSGLAFAPKSQAPIYCGTKAAIHNTTKALRYQLEQTKIKVFEIIPPLVETPMTQGRGSGKITAAQLVNEFLSNFKKDKYESNIGKTKLLRLIQRLSPTLADKIMR